MNFEIPKPPKIHTKVLTRFLGADFTSIIPDERRSPGMKNVINNNGYIETRPGYNQVGSTFSIGEPAVNLKINGIWNISSNKDIYLIHAGTKLYEVDSNFENKVELLDELKDTISKGFYLDEKLIILDGKRIIMFAKIQGTWTAQYLDEVGYIPTTHINRNPDGTGGVSFEDINMLQSKRINTFLADNISTTYVLDDTNLDELAPTVQVLTVEGTWSTITEFTYNKENGTVVFNSPLAESPVPGRDNVKILFSKTNSEALNNLNKCDIGILYGYDGNDNRLFVSGNPDFPNIDWFSKDNDPTYFPSSNFTKIGSEPIINYIILNNGLLGIQKDINDTDNTIYYRKSALFNGKEIFPIMEGVKNIGCISKHANCNLLNDPLTLTIHGVYAVVSDNEEKFAMERSYFINSKLLQEENLHNAITIPFKDKYYLAINNNVYIADSRYKTNIPDSPTEDYQYEWYYWENVPVRVWFKSNNELYFGTEDGKIVKFNDSCLDYSTPIEVYYDTGFLDLNSITEAKTIKQITLITKPKVATEFEIGYTTNEGDTSIIKHEYDTSTFPKTLQENEKIRKFMFVKFYIKNNTSKKLNFYQLALKYIYAGKYRGD